jgi:hypothetical protein
MVDRHRAPRKAPTVTEQQTRSTLDRLIDKPVVVDHDAGTDAGTLYAVTWTAGPHDRYARPVVVYLRNGPIIPWHSVNRIRHADDAAPVSESKKP